MAALQGMAARVVSAALLGASACAAPTDAGDVRYNAMVNVDAGPLLAPGDGVASVLEQVELVVSHPQGGITLVRAPIGAAEPLTALEVELAAGAHRFEARVFSNDGTVLFEGSRDAVIDADGFVVEVDLRAVAGVLVVVPDSVALPGGGQLSATFSVENRGTVGLAWEVGAVQPDDCDGACLLVRPSGGEVGPGGADIVQVIPRPSAQGLYTVTLFSTVGTVELKVLVQPPPPIP